ncbi:MAG TPA: cyclase, partial [Frankiaceae bacterium]|nr:cyclase [Frankiaceae bacterium]
YTLRYTYDGDRKVSWELEAGTLKENHGSYTLADNGGSTEVTYSLTIDAGIPMLGMFKRKAEKVVMDTALKELKKRVESR